ncbi:PIN domain-containing protein [Pseudomonas sp. SDO55104_S430]
MRDAFPEYFVGEPDRQQKLWEECIFVLDTNVLLDLYRFSDSAREALFKVMESLGERLWIPYQVAAEYFDNRLTVIEAQSKAYAESVNGLKAAKEKFNSGTRHPFVSEEVFTGFIASYDLMIKELEDKQKKYISYIEDDFVKSKVGDLLSGRVGMPYTEQELLDVAAEGERRYLENTPPGFQDGGKMPEATTTKLRLKKFGDLILWKQVLEKAAAEGKSVILVTGEKKDDWWLKSGKRLISALPALTKEFIDFVKQDFYLYATDSFLLKANEYLKQDTSDVVVEEVRAINKEVAASVEKWGNMIGFAKNPPLHLPAENDEWIASTANISWPSNGANFSAAKLSRMLDQLMERRIAIQHKAQSLGEQLESLLNERAGITAFQNDYLSTGGSAADDVFVQSESDLARLNALIKVCDEDFINHRKLLRNMFEHQRSLLADRDDN